MYMSENSSRHQKKDEEALCGDRVHSLSDPENPSTSGRHMCFSATHSLHGSSCAARRGAALTCVQFWRRILTLAAVEMTRPSRARLAVLRRIWLSTMTMTGDCRSSNGPRWSFACRRGRARGRLWVGGEGEHVEDTCDRPGSGSAAIVQEIRAYENDRDGRLDNRSLPLTENHDAQTDHRR